MRDLIEYGFSVVTVELRETVEDSRGGEHDVLVDYHAIGGVDSLETPYTLELVTELVAEVLRENGGLMP